MSIERVRSGKGLLWAFCLAAGGLATGCPTPPQEGKVTVQGEITTVVKGPKGDGAGPGVTAKGTWCCKSCGGGGGKPLQCKGCTAMPAGSSQGACPSGGGGPTILVDCPGTTTYDGSTATCF